MQHCKEVFGLEMIEDAIKDAKENAVANEIKNCEFFVGKAEDILSPIIQRTTKPDIIAVVDPPRAGLRKRFSFNIIFHFEENHTRCFQIRERC